MQVLDIVTKLKPDVDQTKVELAIERIESLVKEYCNRSDIPVALNFVVADMVIEYLQLKDENSTNSNAEVKSVREGDTTVEFATNSTNTVEVSFDTILADYKSQLNKHRKMRW